MIKRYGAPSDALVLVRRDGVDVAFLARHGRDHALIPSQTPFRANIHALKSRGVLAGALADAQFAGIRPQPLTGRLP
jgi:purine nucleoside phosphorylase